MSPRERRLVLHAAPFLHTALDTPRLMLEVTLATLPLLVAAAWFFGLAALLVVAATVLGALAAESVFARRGEVRRAFSDRSALLTGVLLGLTLPPGLPLWMAVLGGVVAIALGKAMWGGLGQNLFNPALVGRAFLQAAFPTALTTWRPAGASFWALPSSTFALPFMSGGVDGLSGPTPLAQMKFEHAATSSWSLLVGDVGGSLGETSAGLLLLCGLWLGARRLFDWRIPIGILVTVGLLATVLHVVAPERFPTPLFMLLSGGLLFGCVFMATDPVSSPTTPVGTWVFAVGIGALVVLIRLFGGLPEGVMYAILLMNAATPLIERVCQPRPFGRPGNV